MAAAFLLGIIITSIVCGCRAKRMRRKTEKQNNRPSGCSQPPIILTSPPPPYTAPYAPGTPMVIQNPHFQAYPQLDRSISVPADRSYFSDSRVVRIYRTLRKFR